MHRQTVADLRTVVARTAVVHGAAGIYGNPATDNDSATAARMLPQPAGGGGQGQRRRAAAADGLGGFPVGPAAASMFLLVGFPGTGIDPAAHPPKCLPDETALDVGPRALLQVLLDHPWCALEGNVRSLPVGRRFHIFTAALHAAGCTAVMAIKRPVKRRALQSAHEYP